MFKIDAICMHVRPAPSILLAHSSFSVAKPEIWDPILDFFSHVIYTYFASEISFESHSVLVLSPDLHQKHPN